jgi:hypothetical protein
MSLIEISQKSRENLLNSMRDVNLDQDLQEMLCNARGKPSLRLVESHVFLEQSRRNSMREARASLTPIERRRADAKSLFELNPNTPHEERYHLHSVLALCGLPYRRPTNHHDDYIREYGRNSLVVQPGYLKDPETGRMVKQGIPYGPKARLLLLHVCTSALRQNSHELDVADSMSAFIREMGFAVTGGKRGTIPQFKEQLNRLAAARMQIGLWNGTRSRTVSSQPIEGFDIWLPDNPDQKVLWSSKLTLNKDFYTSLKEHALPVDIRALRAFSQSARQIDVILWLGYRLRNLERTYKLAWSSVQAQFGAQTQEARFFRRDFANDVREIQEVFPDLPLSLTDAGVELKPCDAERIFAVLRKKSLPSR